jgi:hypothetical protein
MAENREKEALDAYIKLLRTKGAAEPTLEKRQDFLLKLAEDIVEIPSDGKKYRNAVEVMLENVIETDWSFFLPVAREYFPFWMRDIKKISSLNSSDGFMLQPLEWAPVVADIRTLWGAVNTEKFGVADTWPIKSYSFALRQAGAPQEMVETRVQLVKLLLIRLKDAPDRNGKFYRLAVDSTLPLFNINETRRLFFGVVREFYYFWIGDPDASKHIIEDGRTSFV